MFEPSVDVSTNLLVTLVKSRVTRIEGFNHSNKTNKIDLYRLVGEKSFAPERV